MYQPRKRREKAPAKVSKEDLAIAKEISEKWVDPVFAKDAGDFEIFTSLRFDTKLASGPITDPVPADCFLLWKYHFARVSISLEYFKWDVELTKQKFLETLQLAVQPLNQTIAYKLRVLVNPEGQLKIETYEVAPIDDLWDGLLSDEEYTSPVYDIYLDPEPVVVSPFTSLKTTKRDHYNSARERCLPGRSAFEDVILHNTAGQMTESSFCNIAILVDGEWITPTLSTGTLTGTVRRYLLSQSKIKEGNVLYKDVKPGQKILLLNSVIGVKKGVVASS